MGEQVKPRSLQELRAVMNRAGADIFAGRISRRQHTAIYAQVEAELLAQGLRLISLIDLPNDAPGGSGEAVAAGPREGARLSG
jgi:hypothetical protein